MIHQTQDLARLVRPQVWFVNSVKEERTGGVLVRLGMCSFQSCLECSFIAD